MDHALSCVGWYPWQCTNCLHWRHFRRRWVGLRVTLPRVFARSMARVNVGVGLPQLGNSAGPPTLFRFIRWWPGRNKHPASPGGTGFWTPMKTRVCRRLFKSSLIGNPVVGWSLFLRLIQRPHRGCKLFKALTRCGRAPLSFLSFWQTWLSRLDEGPFVGRDLVS